MRADGFNCAPRSKEAGSVTPERRFFVALNHEDHLSTFRSHDMV